MRRNDGSDGYLYDLYGLRNDWRLRVTPEQKVAIQTWIDAALPVMLLSGWTVTVVDGEVPGDSTAFAGSFIRDAADIAKVFLGNAFWDETPEDRRATLTHELVHLHLYRYHKHFGDITSRLGKEAEAVADKAAERLEELSVERLAQVIARLLPIPEIPDV